MCTVVSIFLVMLRRRLRQWMDAMSLQLCITLVLPLLIISEAPGAHSPPLMSRKPATVCALLIATLIKAGTILQCQITALSFTARPFLGLHVKSFSRFEDQAVHSSGKG